MSGSIIDRAARALGEVYDGYADPEETPNNWARAQDGVRAVLQAIREPSEAMTWAAESIGADDLERDNSIGFYRAQDVWRAMIDAALTQP